MRSTRFRLRLGPGRLAAALGVLTLLLPSGPVQAGEGGGSTLTTFGLLTFETGPSSRFAFYRDGEFGNPAADVTPEITQEVVDQAPPRTCELDQLSGTPLVFVDQEGGASPGYRDGSLGVFSRGGGNPRGVRCARIEIPERLVLTLVDFDADGDGEPDGLAAIKSRVDTEFKGNAVVLYTTTLNEVVTGRFVVRTGTSAPPNPSPVTYPLDAVLVSCPDLSGQDSNNDAGPSDNCSVELNAPWDVLTVESLFGTASVEGGGDYPAPLENRTEAVLAKVEGAFGCFGTATEGANLLVRRLCDDGVAVPYNLDYDIEGRLISLDVTTGGQDVQFTFDVCWKPEPADALLPTLISYRPGVGPEDADENGIPDCLEGSDPACFEAHRCVGEPTFECFNNSDGSRPSPPVQGCVDRARCLEENPENCVLCDADQTCGLAGLEPPFACADESPCTAGDECSDGSECEPRFPDRDQMLEGDNYGCWYQEDNLLTSQDAIGQCQGIFTNTDVRNFKR